jgi:hypothetical protein
MSDTKDPNNPIPPDNEGDEKKKKEEIEGQDVPPLPTDDSDLNEEELEEEDMPPPPKKEEAKMDTYKDEEERENIRNFNPEPRTVKPMTDEEYIATRLDDQMNWYSRKSSMNKTKFLRYKRIEFIIASIIPVMISLNTMADFKTKVWPGVLDMAYADLLQIIAAAGGVVLVIINKFIELEEYYKYWKEYRVTAEALLHERFLYMTRSEPYDEADAYPLLVEKVESILNNEKQKWKQQQQKQKKQAPQQGQQQAQTQAQPADPTSPQAIPPA